MRHSLPAALAAAIFLLGACAPSEQHFAPPDKTPEIREGAFFTGNGATLPLRSWLPARGRVKAVVIALHGFNDYSNAFTLPGEHLSHHGIALFAYDQRGFGETGARGIWGGEGNYVHDLAQMVRALRAKYPGRPLYVLGESMGGAVAIAALASEDFPPVDGVILSAPAVWCQEALCDLQRGLLWALAHTTPEGRLTGSELKIRASDNIAMLEALGRDPLVIKRTRIDAIYGLMQLMDAAFEHMPRVTPHALLLYGANDEVIPGPPMRALAERMGDAATVAFYPEGYHMLLRDLQAEVVWGDIAHWVTHPGKALPSGHDAEWREVLR